MSSKATPDTGKANVKSGGTGTGKKSDNYEPPAPKIELNAKQKKDIRDAFDAFDSKGTGQMDARELKVAMRALGFEPRKNEIKKLVAQVDKNNTGALCFADFLDIICIKLAEKDTKDEILKAFKLFDRDQTGKITFQNLQQIAAELGEGLNDEEVQEMIAEADLDGDNAVNEEEFFNIMKKTSLY